MIINTKIDTVNARFGLMSIIVKGGYASGGIASSLLTKS